MRRRFLCKVYNTRLVPSLHQFVREVCVGFHPQHLGVLREELLSQLVLLCNAVLDSASDIQPRIGGCNRVGFPEHTMN